MWVQKQACTHYLDQNKAYNDPTQHICDKHLSGPEYPGPIKHTTAYIYW